MTEYRSMDTAPKDGTRIGVLLRDALGAYPVNFPVVWRGGRWVNDYQGVIIVVKIIGWRPW